MHSLRPLARAWSHSIAVELRSKSHANGWTFDRFQQEYKKQYAERLGKMYYENGIRPLFAILAPISQIPVWIAASLGLRQLCDPSLEKAAELAKIGLQNVPVELANSAFLWAPSLVVPDPTWIGPVMLASVHLANVHIAMRNRGASNDHQQEEPSAPVGATGVVEKAKAWDRQKMMLWGMRGVAVAMVPVAKTVPFALVVYWLTSAGFSLVQNVVFKVILARPMDPLPSVQPDTPSNNKNG
ncbi:60Kd inner membrane protein-domain-containing protein, partial [Catenaria anguillulae PL171]